MTDDEYAEALQDAVYGRPLQPIGCFVGGRTSDGEVRMAEMTLGNNHPDGSMSA
jgi:hypothetical protein